MNQINYYVSTKGNDANDGSLQKPFRTLARAQQAIMRVCATEANDTHTKGRISHRETR